MTFEEAKQQAIERSEWVLCHGDGYYTARTPDGRDIIGKGENGIFVGGEYRRVVVRVHKATESIEVYFGMERNGLISALEVGRVLPPRDPPGDGGRREGGGQVFTGTQLHTL